MLGWFRRNRLSERTRRRLLIALARSEERLVEIHVENALELADQVADEIPLHRAVELYLEATSVSETQAEMIARRVFARMRA